MKITEADKVDVTARGDTIHGIYDVGLKDGAKLHRFKNGAGIPYSAIYVDGHEEASCERPHEAQMLTWWENEIARPEERERMMKPAKVRQTVVTWYTPDEKLPPEDFGVVVTLSGHYGLREYTHALGLAWYYEGEGWLIDDMSEEESDAMTIEAWADLDPYGMEA